mmetsp:Transcript_31172/g.89345  ORF Transcript_31172/g.89345 Transcript_31172/m.89345 type:complete len:265 (-) Transcript_31172:43-837(-)
MVHDPGVVWSRLARLALAAARHVLLALVAETACGARAAGAAFLLAEVRVPPAPGAALLHIWFVQEVTDLLFQVPARNLAKAVDETYIGPEAHVLPQPLLGSPRRGGILADHDVMVVDLRSEVGVEEVLRRADKGAAGMMLKTPVVWAGKALRLVRVFGVLADCETEKLASPAFVVEEVCHAQLVRLVELGRRHHAAHSSAPAAPASAASASGEAFQLRGRLLLEAIGHEPSVPAAGPDRVSAQPDGGQGERCDQAHRAPGCGQL